MKRLSSFGFVPQTAGDQSRGTVAPVSATRRYMTISRRSALCRPNRLEYTTGAPAAARPKNVLVYISTRVVYTCAQARVYTRKRYEQARVVTHMRNAGGKPHTLSPGYAPEASVVQTSVLVTRCRCSRGLDWGSIIPRNVNFITLC